MRRDLRRKPQIVFLNHDATYACYGQKYANYACLLGSLNRSSNEPNGVAKAIHVVDPKFFGTTLNLLQLKYFSIHLTVNVHGSNPLTFFSLKLSILIIHT